MKNAEFGPSFTAPVAEQQQDVRDSDPFARRPRRIHFEPKELAENQRRIAAEQSGTGNPEAEDMPVEVLTEAPAAERNDPSHDPKTNDFIRWVEAMPETVREGFTSSQLLDMYSGATTATDIHLRKRAIDTPFDRPDTTPHEVVGEREKTLHDVGQQTSKVVEAIVEHVPLTEQVLPAEADAPEVISEQAHLGDGVDMRFEIAPQSGTINAVEIVVAEPDGDESHESDIVIANPESSYLYVEIDGKPAEPNELPVVQAVLEHVREVSRQEQPEEAPQVEAEEATAPAAEQIQQDPELATALKAKGNALQYITEIARASPQMKELITGIVADMAAQNGMKPGELMQVINNRDTPPSGEALAAIRALSAQKVRADSPLWREMPNNSSVMGKAVVQYRRAVEIVLRGMV